VFKHSLFRTVSCTVALVCNVVLASGCQNGAPFDQTTAEPTSELTIEQSKTSPSLDGDASVGADAGAGSGACSVALVATHQHGPQRTTDGSASFSQDISFAIPSSIPVVAGAAAKAEAVLSFWRSGRRKDRCEYHLRHNATSMSFEGCSNGAKVGEVQRGQFFNLTFEHGDEHCERLSAITIALALPESNASCASQTIGPSGGTIQLAGGPRFKSPPAPCR
jgi:hypothetical protein